MRKALLLSMALLSSLQIHCQQLKVGTNIGYGTYQLTDIKQLQSDIQKQYSFLNVKKVEAFPANYFYTVYTNYQVTKTEIIGLSFTYLTTGGRNHVQDYSGEVTMDMLLNGYKFGLQYQNVFYTNKALNISMHLASGLISSTLSVSNEIQLFDISGNGYIAEVNKEDLAFVSLGAFVEPSLVMSYKIHKNLITELGVGYEVDFGNKLHEKGEKDHIVSNSEGEVSVDWSGFRAFIGLNFEF